jgi:N-acetylneuraminate synthase
MQIAGRPIGIKHPPFVIAEVAQSHEGSLGNAFAFAEVARDCGADAIKFQTHIAAEESTPGEPWRIPFSKQDASRYDYWQRMEFTFDQWAELKAHCDRLGIVFLSSPFSLEACRWLDRLDVPAWKVASGEIHNPELIDYMVASGRPMMLSTGLASPDEGIAAVRAIAERGTEVALFHCTTQYPTPPREEGLNVLADYIAALSPIPVGLSDHSGTEAAGTIAAYLGASLLEVHLTLHEKAFGPDVSSSLTPPALERLVKAAHAAWEMRSHPVDKAAQLGDLASVRQTFTRSLVAARDIAGGETIGADDVAYKKPAGGMAYDSKAALVGRTALRDLPRDHQFKDGDVG